MQYTIYQAAYPAELVSQVNAATNAGGMPVGGVCRDGGMYIQAVMTRMNGGSRTRKEKKSRKSKKTRRT